MKLVCYIELYNMRVLMLSLDRKILERNSAVRKRFDALSQAVGEIVVLTPRRGVKVFRLFSLWRESCGMLRQKSFDLITVQDTSYLALLGVVLARKFRIPLEVQVHGLEKFSGIRKRIALFVLRKATRVRAVSQRLSRLAVELGVSEDRIYVLSVYTQMGEKGERGEMRRTRKEAPHPFTFLTVGRLVPVKNISLQIRAFARLAKEVPHIRLRMVGGGPEMRNLKMKVHHAKLEDKIFFEGYQKDLQNYYAEADAFLLTSDSEGWGLAALEAAAYRLPIIMTNVGLANEVLHHDKECIVIPVGNELALLDAMRKLYADSALRKRLGEAAYHSAEALPSASEQIQEQVAAWRSFR